MEEDSYLLLQPALRTLYWLFQSAPLNQANVSPTISLLYAPQRMNQETLALQAMLIDRGFRGLLYQVVVGCQFLEHTSPCTPLFPHHW